MTERGADFDAKREVYIQAAGVRDWLVNNPGRSAPVSEYRSALASAGELVSDAHKAMMGAWG